MGNLLDAVPDKYSDETAFGSTATFGSQDGSSYMAAYRQNSATADSMSYGKGRLQFGVKIIQDIDPGPNVGQLYVVNDAGKRLYITHDGKMAPYASDYVKQGQNYGNGPAVSITGNPLHPQYNMWYSPQGDEHDASGEWTPITINSKKDILEAMQSGMQGMDYNGKHANMWGQASINPFGAKEGSSMWTTGVQVGKILTGVVSQAIVPVAEMGLDALVPGASTILAVTGANKAMQKGIDALVAATPTHAYQGSKQFDPQISNIIKDPRLPGFLQQQQDQSHAFIAKYGPSKYVATNQLAQDTPSQQIQKAQQLQEENEDLYATSEAQKLTDLSSKLESMVGPNPLFQQIKTGLATATNNQQTMNVISHFSKQLQQQVLPLLASKASSAAVSPSPAPVASPPNAIQTASAQVGHPTLSINGTHTDDPSKTVITGSQESFAPIVPI